MYQGVLSARGQWILFADADGATKFSDFTKVEKSALNAMKVSIKKNIIFLNYISVGI
jgi:hypothetical protein